jgi:alpha,alpha-trehalase
LIAGASAERKEAGETAMGRKCTALDELKAFIFDLDGVVTRTAGVHAASWKRLFDAFLQAEGERQGRDFGRFEQTDYNRHVDGKPRYDGVRSFLAARGIALPDGSPDDPPDRETVCGLGNRKNDYFRQALAEQGVEVYASTVDFIHRLRERGVKVAVISSSENCVPVLARAGLLDLFDAIIDGIEAAQLNLPGKPAPDIFYAAARRLGMQPAECAVVEDALAGVAAGAAGNFACVIGVDRAGKGDQLRQMGADIVVGDLAELAVESIRQAAGLPSALASVEAILARRESRELTVFLDYDGVLTPIVPRPEDALISAAMRRTVEALAARCTVAVISGRDLADVRRMAGIAGIAYAGSHGFDIDSPDGRFELAKGTEYLPALDRAEKRLAASLTEIPGARLERKRFAIAVHFRQVAAERVAAVEAAVVQALRQSEGLRMTGGKKIFELRPAIDWDKGKAVLFLLEKLGLGQSAFPLYLGDDLTDEDAFRALQGKGIGIYVGEESRPTAAAFRLANPQEVQLFLEDLTRRLDEASI